MGQKIELTQEERYAVLACALGWSWLVLMRFASKNLADIYMRNLKDNNPSAHAHSYVLRPAKA